MYYGWNMVGNPFPFPVDWSSVVVEYMGERLPAAEAADRGWLADSVFRYDNVYQRYIWRGVESAIMMPWEAQWVKAKVRAARFTPDAWSDEFNDGVLDPSAPEPHWTSGSASGGAVAESGGYLKLTGTSGMSSQANVSNSGYLVYDDFAIKTRIYLADATATSSGGSSADIRFRADADGVGYSLSFKPNDSPSVICLRRTDTDAVIQSKQVNLPSGTLLYVTIKCIGSRVIVRVGTALDLRNVVDWDFEDATFAAAGSFRLVNQGLLDCRWDYFSYEPVRLADVKLIVPPNAYTGSVR